MFFYDFFMNGIRYMFYKFKTMALQQIYKMITILRFKLVYLYYDYVK